MHYVYLLQSEADPRQRYVGSTDDLKLRLQQHNAGESPHTAKFRPWKLHAYFAFEEKNLAADFEQYLIRLRSRIRSPALLANREASERTFASGIIGSLSPAEINTRLPVRSGTGGSESVAIARNKTAECNTSGCNNTIAAAMLAPFE